MTLYLGSSLLLVAFHFNRFAINPAEENSTVQAISKQ